MIVWDEIVVQTPRSLLFFAVGCAVTVCGQLVLLAKVQSPTEELVDASATVPGEDNDDDEVWRQASVTADEGVGDDRPEDAMLARGVVSTPVACVGGDAGVALHDGATSIMMEAVPAGSEPAAESDRFLIRRADSSSIVGDGGGLRLASVISLASGGAVGSAFQTR